MIEDKEIRDMANAHYEKEVKGCLVPRDVIHAYECAFKACQDEKKVDMETIINFILNDAEIAIPIEKMFNEDKSHITKKKYGTVLLEVLCDELREKFPHFQPQKPVESDPSFVDWLVWNRYVPHGLPLRNGNLFHKQGDRTTFTLEQLYIEFKNRKK